MAEEQIEEGYKYLKPYWEAWKANNGRPADKKESEYWDGMVELFRAVSGKKSAKCDDKALSYILKARPRWLSELKGLQIWNELTQCVTLYRGVRDCAAIHARKCLRDASLIIGPESKPICYSIDIGAAKGFARKGHISGCVYSIQASLDSVVFYDHDDLYSKGGLNKEREVVVWHNTPTPITIVEKHVNPQQPTFRNRVSRNEWLAVKRELEDKEKSLISC